MKKISLTDYILVYLAKLLGLIFRAMPVALALFIARRLGEAISLFNPKRKRIAYANLKAAFEGRYAPEQLKKIVKNTYANIGQGALEVLLLPKIDKTYIERFVEFEDFNIAKDALRRGKGLIFMTAHFGNWEMSNAALPLAGFAYTAIARQQKPYLLNELLNSYRESKGCRIVTKGLGVKEAFRRLGDKGIVGMLVDQDAGKNGVFVKLFGREASFNPGVMEIAIRTGAPIIPGFAIRIRGPYIKFKLFKPIEFPKNSSKDNMIKEGFKQYASILEELIRRYPDQWLWPHRRWKSTPVKKVLILNDRRTGHLRQSEAVLKKIKQLWQHRGYGAEYIDSKVIDVSFKNRFFQKIFSLCSNLSNKNCQGCMRCLKFCLGADSYKTLVGIYADIIISCGSSTAVVNLLLSKENNAKSVVVMKPSGVSLKKFDLAIIPQHDKPPGLKNVVVTDGALNLIDSQCIRYYADSLVEDIGNLKKSVMGLLIGGDTKDFVINQDSISRLLDEIINVSLEFDSDILVTTSRRTSKEIENIIRSKLAKQPNCKLLLIANEKNIEGAVEAILGLSKLCIISQESISMISEAASSGCYTIVFRDSLYRNKRHNEFLQNLNRNNFIKIADASTVYKTACDFFKNRFTQNILDDSSKIEGAIGALL